MIVNNMNGREFIWIRRCLKNARECIEDGNYKGALLELRKPMKKLESEPVSTRLLALCKLTQADAYHCLQRKKEETACLEAAEFAFRQVNDTESDEYKEAFQRLHMLKEIEKRADHKPQS